MCTYTIILHYKGHGTEPLEWQGPCLIATPTKEMVNESSNPTGRKS